MNVPLLRERPGEIGRGSWLIALAISNAASDINPEFGPKAAVSGTRTGAEGAPHLPNHTFPWGGV
jgi:hypothetical protein